MIPVISLKDDHVTMSNSYKTFYLKNRYLIQALTKAATVLNFKKGFIF